MISCMLGYTRLPEMLIKNGADVNKQNKYGITALHMAVCYEHVSTVKLLLQHGADKYIEVNDLLAHFYSYPFVLLYLLYYP